MPEDYAKRPLYERKQPVEQEKQYSLEELEEKEDKEVKGLLKALDEELEWLRTHHSAKR